LLARCGPDYVLELLDRGVLSLFYLENIPGAMKSEKPGREPRYDFALIASPSHTLEQKLPTIVREIVPNLSEAEKFTRRLFSRVQTITHHKSIPDLARADPTNSKLTQDVLAALIKHKAPTYQIPEPLIFRFEQTDDLYSITTNLDFPRINQSVAEVGPQAPEDVITPESLLVYLADVNSEIHFAAKFKSDLLTPPENTIVADRKLGQIFSSLTARTEDIRILTSSSRRKGSRGGELWEERQNHGLSMERVDLKWVGGKLPCRSSKNIRDVTKLEWRYSVQNLRVCFPDRRERKGVESMVGLALEVDSFWSTN
jgi:hypothetical protein